MHKGEKIKMKNKIPRIIHSVWVGGNKKNKLILKCEKSWRKYCKNYKFIEWNENNFDISKAPIFVQESYDREKWAFVSDYIRLFVINKYGGVYLDSDMEVLKPFDKFLKENCFLGLESREDDKNIISCGIIGSTKSNWFIQKCLKYYENKKKYEKETITKILTKILNKEGFDINKHKKQNIKGVMIYERKYFYPFTDGENPKKFISKDSYCCHHWNASWYSKRKKIYKYIRNFLSKIGILKLIILLLEKLKILKLVKKIIERL